MRTDPPSSIGSLKRQPAIHRHFCGSVQVLKPPADHQQRATWPLAVEVVGWVQSAAATGAAFRSSSLDGLPTLPRRPFWMDFRVAHEL